MIHQSLAKLLQLVIKTKIFIKIFAINNFFSSFLLDAVHRIDCRSTDCKSSGTKAQIRSVTTF